MTLRGRDCPARSAPGPPTHVVSQLRPPTKTLLACRGFTGAGAAGAGGDPASEPPEGSAGSSMPPPRQRCWYVAFKTVPLQLGAMPAALTALSLRSASTGERSTLGARWRANHWCGAVQPGRTSNGVRRGRGGACRWADGRFRSSWFCLSRSSVRASRARLRARPLGMAVKRP